MTQKHSFNLAGYIRDSLVRQLLGLILIATGLGKLLDIPGFVQVLANYQLLPTWGGVVMAYALPFIELITGLGLLTANYLRAAASSTVILHIMLLTAASVTMWRGIHLDNCGCFGVFLARPLGIQTLIEDSMLLLLSLWVLFHSTRYTEETIDLEV